MIGFLTDIRILTGEGQLKSTFHPSKMSFNVLSDDIVLDIFDLVWDLPYTLCNIALSSKRLNDLATPLLYKELDLDTWNGEVSLLKTLLRNPELGYVRFMKHQLLWMLFTIPDLTVT